MRVDLSRFWCTVPVIAACVAAGTAAGATGAPSRGRQPQPAALSVTGDVPHPLSLSLADLRGMPRTTIAVQENGAAVTYQGVSAAAVLDRAGAPLGHALTGAALSTYVRAIGSDGYEAVFSLAELDPAMTSNEILIADLADGKAIDAPRGPLRIIAPHDARPARSVRTLIRLDVGRTQE